MTTSKMSKQVRIVEVGPRDGLQNEKAIVPAAVKIELIRRLIQSGLKSVEVTSFVSPKWVPQMADNSEVLTAVLKEFSANSQLSFPVLTPNVKGMESAIQAGAKEVAIFAAASESFSQKNINCSIAESLQRFEPLMQMAIANRIKVRGYVSCIVQCPYEGEVNPQATASVTKALHDLGCYEVSLGDTVGAGNPSSISKAIEACAAHVPINQLAGHYHDTGLQAIANIRASLDLGVRVFDSSVAGLGGCPYAPGAAGNVATEKVLALMNELGFETGVDAVALKACGEWIRGQIQLARGE